MSTLKTYTTADYAASYISKYGMAIVPLPPRSKRPTTKDWGNLALTTTAAAREYFVDHPNDNLGVALGPSGMCSFDIDDFEATRIIFTELGLDLDAMLGANPTIQGKSTGARVMFKVPENVTLPYHSLQWPRQDGSGNFTVFELRSSDGTQRQDVLPPSIHPDTGTPYVWLTKPNGHIPEPPDFLLTIWREWARFKPQLKSLCPWALDEPENLPRVPAAPVAAKDSVIGAYNAANDIHATLTKYGYKRVGSRYLSPHSTTMLPGVHVFKDNRCWIHHASDPLCSEETGQPVNPFDLFAQFEHAGDVSKAVKAAATDLGIKRTRKPSKPQISTSTSATSVELIDQETGEITVQPSFTSPVDFMSILEWGKNGPHNNLDNSVRVLQHDPIWQGKIWYDEFLKRILTVGGNGQPREWSDADDVALSLYLQRTVGLTRVGTKTANEAATYVAKSDVRNECKEWLLSRQWDGILRLETFMSDAFGTPQDAYHAAVSRNWLISIVARVLRPGCKVDTMPVFEGSQGAGKSSALALLGGKWFVECHESVLSKDFYQVLDGHMLVEISEMHSFTKSEVERVKGVISCQVDRYRAPYDRRAESHPRAAVLSGTTNRDDWHRDDTGGRRFWPIFCHEISQDYIINQRDNLFAEAVAAFQAGANWWEMPDLDTKFEVEKRRETDSWEATIEIWCRKMNVLRMHHLLIEALGIEVARQTMADQKRAGKCLRVLGWASRVTRSEGEKIERVWVRKNKINPDFVS